MLMNKYVRCTSDEHCFSKLGYDSSCAKFLENP